MTVTIDGIEYLYAEDAAAKLSTTETRILMLLKRKALEGIMQDDGWLVTKSSLACFENHEQEPEQQPSCRTSCSSSGCGCH